LQRAVAAEQVLLEVPLIILRRILAVTVEMDLPQLFPAAA
jgi:hypothetical protein